MTPEEFLQHRGFKPTKKWHNVSIEEMVQLLLDYSDKKNERIWKILKNYGIDLEKLQN